MSRMEETFSQNFKRIFLLTFTRELIIHSAKREMTKLQSIIESKEQEKGERILSEPNPIFTRELTERIVPVQKIKAPVQRTYEMSDMSGIPENIPAMPSVYPERKVVTIEMNEEPSIRQLPTLPSKLPMKQLPTKLAAKPPIRHITKQGIRYPLFIPEPKLPSHLEYLQPIPTAGVEIDLFKLNPLIQDAAVRIIEVNPDERVIVSGIMGTMPVNIILNKEDIDRVINKFSEASKIPISEGIYKIVVGNLVLSAIVSETISSKFIIKKMLINPNPSESQQQKPQTLPFQDDNLR